MFIFQLMGGLGNQMFAYAAAKSLSLKRGIPVKFDFDCPYQHIKYEYALGIFHAKAEFPTRAELKKVKPKRGIERRLYLFLGKNTTPRLVRELQEFTFRDEFYAIPDNSYVTGFWQSEKYFLPIEKEIRKDFQFHFAPDSKNQRHLDNIDRSNSVAIHIRRGDYVNVAKTQAVHGLCSVDYYQQAMAIIEKSVSDPVYFFFSNDIPWVKENIKTSREHHFIDNNTGAASWEDLRLMSRCKHTIIANSSFSWWGGWLNAYQKKIVIAPKQWMSNPTIDTKDLIPVTWMRL
jgi:hypothetical protein